MQRKIIRVEQVDNSLMHLTWVINNICTNTCSYCPELLHNGTNHNYEWANAKKFFEILFQRYPKIHCSVSGGEPSVSPFFKEIVKTFYDHGHHIAATSNAAKPVSYWEEISNYLSYICFSYHPEFPDKDFIQKVAAAGENTFVTVRVMMYPGMWDQCLDIYNQLIDVPHIFVEPVRIVDWGGKDRISFNYTSEQLQFFIDNARIPKTLLHLKSKSTAELGAKFYFDDGTITDTSNPVDYVNSGMTNFNGYVCEAGLKELYISYSGDIYLANCMIGDPIGNINDPENIRWPTQPIVCNRNLCHCTTDIIINKRLV
jgi:organic radical activating enzyme